MASPPTTVVMMTKDQLRNALLQRGVALPPASAKKDIVLEIMGMTDQQLFNALKEKGVNPGPVTDTTRNTYRNHLLALLSQNQPINAKSLALMNAPQEVKANDGETNGKNGYSDSDDDAQVETASQVSRSSRSSSSAAKRRGRPSSKQEPIEEKGAPAATDVRSVSADKTPSPPKTRSVRRSETPKTPVQRPEPVAPVERRIPERPRQAERDTLQISTGSVSYFKERPGYASTTTSNVLPRKPSAPLNSRKSSREKASERQFSNLLVALSGLLVAAMGAGIALYIKHMSGGEPVRDELDQLLDSMNGKN